MSFFCKSKGLIFLLLFFVTITSGCGKESAAQGNMSSSGAEAQNKTEELIQRLKDEDTKLTGKTLPSDISKINEVCQSIFYSLMTEKESIKLRSNSILESSSNMYVKIGNEIIIDDVVHRLIEFGMKKAAEGGSTNVYIQSFDGKKVSLVEVLNIFTNSSNIARVGPSDIYKTNGNYYVVITDLFFDTDKDSDVLRFNVFSRTNNSWSKAEIKDSGMFNNPIVEKSCTYSIENTDNGLIILIKNREGMIMNDRFIDLSGSTPVIGLYNKDLPIDKGQAGLVTSYEITKETYSGKSIKINYPQLKNMSDPKKQKTLNEVIKSQALKGLNYYGGSSSGITMDINYNIEWKGPRLLSIQFSGYGNAEGAAHPNNLFYTVNINISNGDVIRLKDLVYIDSNFVKKFKNAAYRITNSQAPPEVEEAAKRARDELTDDEIIKDLNNADSQDYLSIGNHSDTFIYFNKENLGIKISVPHVVGDYAEFLINYKDLESSIKSNNEVWKDFYQQIILKK